MTDIASPPASAFETETLAVRLEGTVAELTLTRPELLNRFDHRLHHDFVHALAWLRDQVEVRAVVLASTGKVFSAGGDFDFMRAAHDDLGYRFRLHNDGVELITGLLDFPIPIVAAVHGDAIGLAANVVLACDAVVAAATARLSDPHVAMGLVAGDGGCVLWPQAMGTLRAKRYLLTGDPVTGADAHSMGLVTDLVGDAAEVVPTARALATRIATLPPLGVRGTKRALNCALQQRTREVLDLSMALELLSVGSDDRLEAIQAFKERRPGVYRGR